MWLETSKMDPDLTGSLLGGGLLGDVLNHMATAEAAYQANPQVSFLPVCRAALCMCVLLPQHPGRAPHSCSSCSSVQELQAGSLDFDGCTLCPTGALSLHAGCVYARRHPASTTSC